MDVVLQLLARLGDRARRRETLSDLAGPLGGEEVLLFVRDPELGVLVPAVGCAQTLHGGSAWRRFLTTCCTPGRHAGEVDLPRETCRPAFALSSGEMCIVVLGAAAATACLDPLEQMLPLLGAMLMREQESLAAAAEVAEARDAAERARALSLALEASRAEGGRLNAELQEQHRRKDEFLAMLAHELRNPLSPLVVSIEVLRRVGDSAAVRDRQLQIMDRQLRQLVRLVDDLLDVSRVSRGRIELQRTTLPLTQVVLEALEASRPAMEARGHRVEVEAGRDELHVHADPVRLQQVFGNLLHNAAKYTDPGGTIRLRVSREGSEALVQLIDNGAGISPEVMPRIFDLFEQAPVSLARSEGGLGIGLTLVRALVELHGGRVSAESAGLGQGSTFSVHLPLVPAAHAAAKSIWSAAPRSAGDAQHALSVLVVDDNRDAADSLAEMLRLMGHGVWVAHHASAAQQVAGRHPVDLVLLDIGLPEIDGYEVLRRLKHCSPPGTRFFALTGYGSHEDRQRVQQAGFDGHLVKPASLDDLQEVTGSAKSPGRSPDHAARSRA